MMMKILRTWWRMTKTKMPASSIFNNTCNMVIILISLFFIAYVTFFPFLWIEIWKNTPIMAFDIITMLARYHSNVHSQETSRVGYLFDDFQKSCRQFRDLAYVGSLENVTKYSLNLLSIKDSMAISSVAVDLLKYEALMRNNRKCSFSEHDSILKCVFMF